MVLFMLAAAVPVYAEPIILRKCQNPVLVTGDTSTLPSDDELFAGYVERVFNPEKYRPDATVNGTVARDNLNSTEKGIYDILVTFIKQVASGECSNATFTMSSAQMDEIGLTRYFAGMDMNAAWDEFLKQFDFTKIHKALLSDCPYDLYWYDKTAGINYSSSWYVYSRGSEIAVLQFQFAVSADYSINGAEYTSYVDTSKTGAAANAAEVARSIVKENKSLSDYEKLVAYKDEICRLVDYDYDSVENDAAYGDPWQLIHVFDGDPETKVVCEGYSKAFQYLCDLSNFASDVYCVNVSGDAGGPHMWNIVHMDDGKNYLVDITNSDEGCIGENGGLFLNGAASKKTISYVFNVAYSQYSTYTLTYTYDDTTLDCFGLDGGSILNISMTDYDPSKIDDVVGGSQIVDSGKCGDNLTWTLYRDGELVIDGTGDMWDYRLEYNTGLKGYITTAEWGAYSSELSSLTLSDGITSIGDSAFGGCNFDGELKLPDSLLEIGIFSFMYSTLSGELVLPDKLTHVDSYAFSECDKITAVTIPESMKKIESAAFDGCSELTKVTVYSKNADISDTAFTGTHADFTIYGYAGSTAEEYASKNNLNFEKIETALTLKGRVTAYNPKTPTKLDLLDNGEVKYTIEIAATEDAGAVDAYFEFADIEAGTYDLVVTKLAHLPYTVCGITVGDAEVDLCSHTNAEISAINLISGDVNGDGCIDLKDVTLLTSSNTYGKTYDEADTKSADVNGDGRFDLKDLTIITSEKNYGKSDKTVSY